MAYGEEQQRRLLQMAHQHSQYINKGTVEQPKPQNVVKKPKMNLRDEQLEKIRKEQERRRLEEERERLRQEQLAREEQERRDAYNADVSAFLQIDDYMIFPKFQRVHNNNDFKKIVRAKLKMDEITGIYIIANINNRKVYVGQGVRAIQRCWDHFRERSNSKDNVPEVREDLAKGHLMGVNFIALKDTDFWTLDELEDYYIAKYECVEKGYNHKSGNKTNKKKKK